MLTRLGAFLLLWFWAVDLPAQVPFYQGKTIRLVAGTPAGSVYDSYARLMAQFMPRHIPGNPTIIVQNMPGVASTRIPQFKVTQ
jgi:tripartite-type tricarboxylate transporter receptor subunit TctC